VMCRCYRDFIGGSADSFLLFAQVGKSSTVIPSMLAPLIGYNSLSGLQNIGRLENILKQMCSKD